MKYKFFLFSLFLSFVTSLDAEEVDAEWLSIHQVAAENIDPFYKDLRSSHQYVLGLTQIIDTLSFNDYSVRFYVDTTEMLLTYARDKMCRFARLEFYHQSTKLATFDNDDCFTCLGLKDNTPIMFKAHKIGEDLTLVMRGEEYSDDLPEFCIFLIHNQQVSLIYNKENAILDTKFQGNKTIYHCLSMLGVNETGEEPQYCDIVFEDDKISVFSTKTNSEKMIYVVPENSSECVVRPIDNGFSDEE